MAGLADRIPAHNRLLEVAQTSRLSVAPIPRGPPKRSLPSPAPSPTTPAHSAPLIKPDPDSADSHQPQDKMAEFKSYLQDYGRSIIKSALEHTPEESHALEKNIIISRQKVIAHHTNVSQKLEMAEIRNRNQEATIKSKNTENAELKKKLEEQRSKIECLEKQSASQLSAKLRLLDSLEVEERKVKDLEAELATFRNDRKRKRENIVEVFERVEKVKVD
jgi:prolyl oligopeptidase PreP (S9A serine peptidase family)